MCTWLFAEECDVTKSHFENLDKYRTVLLLHESMNFMTKAYKDLLWEIYVCIYVQHHKYMILSGIQHM